MQTLAIDVREACRPVRTGKGQWVYGFVSELITRNIPLELFTDKELPVEWQQYPHVNSHLFPSGFRWHWNVKNLLEVEAWLYVSPLSYLVPAFLKHTVKCIPVVHDLIAFRPEPHQWKARMVEKLTLRRAAERAYHVSTVSASTKRDLLALYPSIPDERVTPIFAAPMHASVEKNAPSEKSILCIATLCPRKNQERLIEAYTLLPQALRDEYILDLAGTRGWSDESIVSLAEKTSGVHLLGAISDEEYERRMRSATVFALPSLYEGFGMQILDALHHGLPVLTSKRGSIPEVCGDAAEYVDPESAASIAQGLERILGDTARREHLAALGPRQAAQFSWKRTVDLFLASVRYT